MNRDFQQRVFQIDAKDHPDMTQRVKQALDLYKLRLKGCNFQ